VRLALSEPSRSIMNIASHSMIISCVQCVNSIALCCQHKQRLLRLHGLALRSNAVQCCVIGIDPWGGHPQ